MISPTCSWTSPNLIWMIYFWEWASRKMGFFISARNSYINSTSTPSLAFLGKSNQSFPETTLFAEIPKSFELPSKWPKYGRSKSWFNSQAVFGLSIFQGNLSIVRKSSSGKFQFDPSDSRSRKSFALDQFQNVPSFSFKSGSFKAWRSFRFRMAPHFT